MRFSRQVIVAIAASAVVASVISFTAPAAFAAWTDSATANFAESSVIIPAAVYGTCVTDLPTNSANITWPAAAATLDGSPFKQYFIEWLYGTPASPGALILSTTRTSPYAVPTITGLTGNSFVRVTLQYQNGWNTSAPTTYLLTRSSDSGHSPVCNPEMP